MLDCYCIILTRSIFSGRQRDVNTCLVYPSAIGNLQLSASKRMFQVVPLIVQKLSDKRISSTHWHDYLQIWYTVSGSYLHTVEGVAYEQKPGSAMLIFPYTKHSIDSSCSDLDDTPLVDICFPYRFSITYTEPHKSFISSSKLFVK